MQDTTPKVLFITPFIPDDHGGGGTAYTKQLLLELGKVCRIDLIYFRYAHSAHYKPSNENVKVVREITINKLDKVISLLNLPWIFPLFSARFKWKHCRDFQSIIDAGNYDYVYFDFSQTFSYAAYLRHPHKILMSHDVIAQKYSRIQRYNHFWAKASERKLLRHADALFTFSPKDCELFKQLYGTTSHPTTFFLKEEVVNATPQKESDYYVMFGSWNRVENYETLQWVMENIADKLPEGTHIKVLGGGKMPDEVRNQLESNPKMEYVGFMDDPYPTIANAIAELAPLRKGAGVKVKCIEALACGTPIIGTEVAFEGIDEAFRKFMILADTAEDCVNAVQSKGINIADRLQFKQSFIKEYDNKAIIKYILENKSTTATQ